MLASLAVLPYTYSIVRQSAGAEQPASEYGVPCVVFGWLYWRRGLVAAMVSHFAADFLLKAVLPMMGIG